MDGDTLANFNSIKRLAPASNTKLITTGLALRTLGAEHRFGTSIAYSGQIVDSVLHGDLYIVGGGDPTLGSNQYDNLPAIEDVFGEWVSFIRNAGIGSIEGRIVGDDRYFESASYRNWEYCDIGEDYGSVPSGLSFNENIQELRISPSNNVGEKASIVTVYPNTPWRNIRNQVTTEIAGEGSSLDFSVSMIGNDALMRGYIAVDRSPRRYYCSNDNGAMTCASVFSEYLENAGFQVSDGYSDVKTLRETEKESLQPDSCLVVIGTTYSPTLKEIVYDTNHVSDNFYAEALLLHIAKAICGESGYGACQKSRKAALDNLGVGTMGCRILDGSGLSRNNSIKPEFFVSYLKAMRNTPEFEDFLKSLPQPGNGTLTSRLKKAPEQLRSRVYMKSGSLLGVLCYSGYMMSSDGNPKHDIVFSIMTNNAMASHSEVGKIIDRLIESMGNE